MFERRVQTANDFRSRFKERLRLRLGYLINVAAQMIASPRLRFSPWNSVFTPQRLSFFWQSKGLSSDCVAESLQGVYLPPQANKSRHKQVKPKSDCNGRPPTAGKLGNGQAFKAGRQENNLW